MLPRGTTLSLCLALALALASLPGCGAPPPPASPPGAEPSASASPEGGDDAPEPPDELAALDALLARHAGGDLPADLLARARFRRAWLLEDRASSGESPDDGKLAQAASAWLSLATAPAPAASPASPEPARVAYQLGHTLLDAGRWSEAQQAFLALACSDRFKLKADPQREGHLLVEPRPHDHDEAYWRRWEALRLVPEGSRLKPKGKGPGEEAQYEPIYDNTCKPLPGGSTSALLEAEAWLRVGERHQERLDERDGPYALHRAATAFGLAIARASASKDARAGALREVASFRLVQTLLLERRYEAAAKLAAEMLGSPPGGGQLVTAAETAQLLAEAIARAEQPDPPEAAPLSPLSPAADNDDLARRDEAVVARAQSPRFLPQGRPFTLDVYDALSAWLLEADRPAAAARVLEAALAKWPDDARSPALRERLERARTLTPAPVVIGPAQRAPKPEKTAKKKGPSIAAPRPPRPSGITQVETAPSPRTVITLSMLAPFRHDPALPVVRRCALRLARQGKPAAGRLQIAVTVDDQGNVTSTRASGPLAELFSTCVSLAPDAVRALVPSTAPPDLLRQVGKQVTSAPYGYDLIEGEAVPVPQPLPHGSGGGGLVLLPRGSEREREGRGPPSITVREREGPLVGASVGDERRRSGQVRFPPCRRAVPLNSGSCRAAAPWR